MRTSFVHTFLLFYVSVVMIVVNVQSQTIDISQINIQQFPTVRARLLTFDKNGTFIPHTASTLRLKENGNSNVITSITCNNTSSSQPISVAIGIDASVSMNYAEQLDSPLQLTFTSVNTLLSKVQHNESEFTLQTSDAIPQIIQDATTIRSNISTGLTTIKTTSGNNFSQQLLHPVTGLIAVASALHNKKVILFCTDGRYGVLPEADVLQCITLCRLQNITFCSLIYTSPNTDATGLRTSLRTIADSTGGYIFENIVSTQDALNKAAALQQLLQGATPCTIEWQSDYACHSEIRTIEISSSSLSVSTESFYLVPDNGITRLQFSSPIVHFYNTKPGIKHDTTITITALYKPYSVTSITTSNPVFSVSPNAFTLRAGEQIKLTVSCTPTDSSYTWSQISFTNSTCSSTLYGSCGFTGKKPIKPSLQVLFPNGKEKIIPGLDTTITWSGIPLTDTVQIDYSTDKGIRWNMITNKATEGTYQWEQIPSDSSDNCLIRVQQLAPFFDRGWARHCGSDSEDRAYAVSSDSLGNIVIAGSFSSTMNIGNTTITSNGGTDVFISKYNPKGELLWSKKAGGVNNDVAKSLAIDKLGNIYITGQYTGNATFDTVKVTGTSDYNIFLAKYTKDGSIVWIQTMGSDAYDHGNSLALDRFDNLYLAGDIAGRTQFSDTVVFSRGSWDSFIAKYTVDGQLQWVRVDGGNEWDESISITCDTSGNVYSTGVVEGSATFSSTTVRSIGSTDIFVAKYDSTGSMQWVKNFGSIYEDKGTGICYDYNGNIYVAGSFSGISIFDTLRATSKGQLDICLAKISTDGNVIWVKSAGGNLDDEPLSVCYDTTNTISITGYFNTKAVFSTDTIVSQGKSDIFIAAYSLLGDLHSIRREGSDSADRAQSIIVTPDNHTHVAGYCASNIIIESENLVSEGSDDAIVWRIGQRPLQLDVSDVAWSLVKPNVHITDTIHIGTIPLGVSKDTIVTNVITNVSNYPVKVNTWKIIGADSSSFKIIGNNVPCIIDTNSSKPIELSFSPKHTGINSVLLEIITPFDTLHQVIQGFCLPSLVKVETPIIDLGKVWIHTRKDTLLAITLRNVNSDTLTIANSSIVSASQNSPFFITLGGGGFRLAPGQSRTMIISFAPNHIGRVTSTIEFEYSGYGSPAKIHLSGEGFEENVSIDVSLRDTSAYPGNEISIPISITGNKNLTQSGTKNLQLTIQTNSTLLTTENSVVSSNISNDTLVFSINTTLPQDNSGILSTLKFNTALGNDTSCNISVIKITSNNQPLTFRQKPSRFTLQGVCKSDGGRLFSINGNVAIHAMYPNPASSESTLEFETIEHGITTISILDVLGNTAYTLLEQELPAKVHTLQIPTDNLSNGRYYVIIKTPSVTKVTPLQVLK